MNLEELANVRHRVATVYCYFLMLTQRVGEDLERGEAKFSAGVTVKFSAPVTMHAEERQKCPQRHLKCEQKD